mgnify:CR=1 FL=1
MIKKDSLRFNKIALHFWLGSKRILSFALKYGKIKSGNLLES